MSYDVVHKYLMGCDIHAFLEFSDEQNSKDLCWSKFADLHLSRRYEYFDAIAGVRKTLETGPLIKPRGIPKDFEVGSNHWLHNDGLHHHGFLSYDEVVSSFDHAKINTNQLTPDWMAMLSAMKTLFQFKIVRIVFAFDN